MRRRTPSLLAVIGPGVLVAATGVGVGDLATAGFAGNRLGLAVLWAIVVGAFIKYVLTEGLARWQLATGRTLLEGALVELGWPARVVFGVYLVLWSYIVGAALINAAGAAGQALLQSVGIDASSNASKIGLGLGHSLAGVAVAWLGGFKWLERILAICIAIMFVSVIVTAALCRPDVGEILVGLVWPRIPEVGGAGLTWTIGLMGGVGGTLTVLCYGYWIRERGRTDISTLKTCRVDLGIAYTATALFGIAMLVIAAQIPEPLDGRGVGFIVAIAGTLEASIGTTGRVVFLVGAWTAIVSSLLGVWQAVPYVFADFWRILRGGAGVVDTRARPYRVFLLALAIVPLLHVTHPFREVQKAYVVTGAVFIPLLAAVLLILNGRRRLVGEHVNGRATVVVLVVALMLSALASFMEIRTKL